MLLCFGFFSIFVCICYGIIVSPFVLSLFVGHVELLLFDIVAEEGYCYSILLRRGIRLRE